MPRQEKFKHKKFLSALWPPLSLLLCIVYLHYALTKPPHQQQHLLSHKEQHAPSITKTTP